MNKGFNIFDEEIVFEDGRFFEILLAKYSAKKLDYSEKDIYISKALVEKKDKLYLKLLKEREEILKNILENFDSKNDRSLKRYEQLELNLKYLREAIDEISS